ncbi:auxilin-like protein 1 [Mercurialis annua]|uniref:auxilin-like protein 1 n=1 Tax=Mercurialis annua TaxID=3986 RepID=UPI00215EDAC6|nr:auxilin-like protein 1 [Mercurialis annua]
MENLPHSRQPNIFSKKTCNGSSTKSIYDDVFGGPPRSGAPTLAPRVEDYSEIFGGFHSSRASSIPVLDLPLIGDEPVEYLFDVRGSGFDYSEVFGGFNGHDFAVSYEEMVMMMMMEQSNGRADSSDDDEAWTPAGVDSLSEELDHSMKDRCFSNRDSHESVDDSVEFNISYNQYGGRISEDSSNGVVHVTQHHNVSGHTCSVDKTNSLPKADYEYWSLQESNEDDLNITYSGDMLKGRLLRKVMSHPANGSTDGLNFRNDVRTSKEFVRNNSLPGETFVTISDVSLRTWPSHLPPPSRPPPALDEKKGDCGKTSPTFEAIASEEIGGESSPPYFDVEIDASSSAGVSAAAMKEAMQKAQAKLKSAKESMERKREGCGQTKLGTKTDRKVKEEKISKHGYGSKKDDGGQVICEREKNGMKFCVSEEKQNIRNISQLMLNSMEGKTHPKVAKLSAEESRGRECFSSQGSGEWKEATEFFELVTDKSRKCFGQDSNENILISNSSFSEHEKRSEKANLEALQRLQGNAKKVKAVRADHQLEETEKISEVSIEAFKRDKFSGRSEAANKQKVEMEVHCSTSRGSHEVNGSDTAGKEDHNPEKIREASQTECKWEEIQKLYDDVGESGKEEGLNKIGADHSEFNQAHNLAEDKNHQSTQLQGKHERNIEKEEATDVKLTELKKIRNEAAPGIVQPNKQERSQLQMEDITSTEMKTIEKFKSSMQVDSDIGNQGKKFGNERNGRKKTIEQTQVPLYQDNNKGDFMPTRVVRESVETGRKTEAAQPTILEVKESSSRIGQQPLYQDNNRDDFAPARLVRESVETGRKTEAAQPTILEVKGSSSRIGQQVNASQSTERKLKNGASSSEDKEAERLKREREQEKERLRRMEEEWEREREREKDRMAVDRATLETRESASAEARERAERAAVEKATSEARQRALNEARERLEKACADAREKTLSDKVPVEARLGAERAAVERATAEARERAFEKAMAETATFEARERIERSISDKFSTSTGTGGTKPGSSSSDQQDLLSKGASSFNGSGYQYSFSNERFEEVEGESVQRCKARLERHRRTAERAANALAEKNMRDHLAQREQAERSRLAETLDADVKRWSNGKEGNLRALLSTLQYILGPDSGWQPIPLTEVITPTAAKKAYRKATLCVHPDKLQQRGATIRQKYICEKVFDFLKEAWNKFNSEER